MSKSRGNTVDPLEFMDKYGSDALRFTLARGANPGTDQALAEEWVAGSRNFATKLWNASRFAMMNGAHVNGALPEPQTLNHIDQWILNRLNETITEVDSNLEAFEFQKACDAVYHFAWDDVCDWYLELTKDVFARGGAEAEATKRVLGHVFDQLLRLLHPIMPFITEALWKPLTHGESLVVAQWPVATPLHNAESVAGLVGDLQTLITEIRRFRNDQGIKTSAKIAARISGLTEGGLSAYESSVRFITKLEPASETFNQSAKVEIGKFVVEFDLTGAIDVGAERARLTKDLATIEKDKKTAEVKLNNENFMAKAPMEVVKEIRERLDFCNAEIERITALLASLPKA